MVQQPIRITVEGTKKALKRYDAKQAISEYIWNGFDAGATEVEIQLDLNELDGITEIRIIDNGSGIPHENLDSTFRPFFQSEKELQDIVNKKVSAIHGKNGVGRLTFFHFARYAEWKTIYTPVNEDINYIYSINIDIDTLNEFSNTEPKPIDEALGTMVRFSGIIGLSKYHFETEIYPYLVKEFAWFLELNSAREFALLINRIPIDYSNLIGDIEETQYEQYEDGQLFEFDIKYVRWVERLSNEYSHYYYIGSDNVERQKETTTLNNKGDSFYHSVYIKSDYFDMIHIYGFGSSHSDDGQLMLPTLSRRDEIFRGLKVFVDNFLRAKRKPFLRSFTDKLIQDYEEAGVFPDFGQNEWDVYRHKELEKIVRELYQVEPKLFSNLNLEQKKTFIHLLNLALDEAERSHLFDVLREITDLESSELADLAQLLKRSKLSNIIKTIRLIEDRFKVVEELKQLVFSSDLYVTEPNHIQKMVESHYWLFGEEYHLVTAAEPKFEEALRRYIFHLRGENREVKITHKDKQREMDIFAVRLLKETDEISNIVVELKNPKVRLGEKELHQVKKYLRVIREQPEFNAKNMTWKFYLIGNRFDTSGFIQGEIKNSINHGERSLVYSIDEKQVRIYVKTWSEIFTEFELRHNFLLEKLKTQRDELAENPANADEIIQSQIRSTAVRPSEVLVPEND